MGGAKFLYIRYPVFLEVYFCFFPHEFFVPFGRKEMHYYVFGARKWKGNSRVEEFIRGFQRKVT